MGQQSSADAGNGDGAGIPGTCQEEKRHLRERYYVQKVKLGQGSFATVWRAVDRNTGKTVALKCMDKSTMEQNHVDRRDIEREIAVMRVCDHENITRLWDTFEDIMYVYLSLEYCDCGDLSDKILERGLGIQEAEVVDWMRQVCNAMAALHNAGVCHRDVKPENFMLQAVSGASGLCLKLSDFGLACFLHNEGRLQTRCGTPLFMAPEVHAISASCGYSFPADMWSVGVSMYVMMFGGRGPFVRDRGEVDFKALFAGAVNFRERVDVLGLAKVGCGRLRFSEGARNFCKRLLQCDPLHRPTAAEAKANPWLQGPAEGRKLGPTKVLRPGPGKRSNLDAPSRWGTVLSEMATGTKTEDVAFTEDLGALAVRTASKAWEEKEQEEIGYLAIETSTEVVSVPPVKNRFCKSEGATVPADMGCANKPAPSRGVFKERDWDRSDAEAKDALVLPDRGDPPTPSTASDTAETVQGESLDGQFLDRLHNGPQKFRLSRRFAPPRGESSTDDAGMESDNTSTTDGAWQRSSSFLENADASADQTLPEQRLPQAAKLFDARKDHEPEQTKVDASKKQWNAHDCRLWLQDDIKEHAVREYEWEEWLNQVDAHEPVYMQEELPLPAPDTLGELPPEQVPTYSSSCEQMQACASSRNRSRETREPVNEPEQACASSRNRSRETREPDNEPARASRPQQEDDGIMGAPEVKPEQQQLQQQSQPQIQPSQQQGLEQEWPAQQHTQHGIPTQEEGSGQLLEGVTCKGQQDVAHSQQSRAESELDENQQQQQQQQQSVDKLPSTVEVQSRVCSDLEREVRDLLRGMSVEDQLTANKQRINELIQEQLGACLKEQMSQLQEQQVQLQVQRQDLEQREAALSSAHEEPGHSATPDGAGNCCRRLLRIVLPRKTTARLDG